VYFYVFQSVHKIWRLNFSVLVSVAFASECVCLDDFKVSLSTSTEWMINFCWNILHIYNCQILFLSHQSAKVNTFKHTGQSVRVQFNKYLRLPSICGIETESKWLSYVPCFSLVGKTIQTHLYVCSANQWASCQSVSIMAGWGRQRVGWCLIFLSCLASVDAFIEGLYCGTENCYDSMFSFCFWFI
jgi:hypothetical protein